MKCSFCGSEKTRLDSNYLDKFGEKIYTYCCRAQEQNDKYAKAHTSRQTGEKPEDIDKW